MNNTLRRISIGMAVAALSMVALAVQDTVTLKRAPKEGEVVKYRLSAVVDVMGSQATFTSLVTEKVTKVETNGNYVIESLSTEGKLVFDGSEMPAPETPASKFTYTPLGSLVAVDAAETNAQVWRMANLSSFQVPDRALRVGDKWDVAIKSNPSNGSVAAKGSFTVEAFEKVGDWDTVRVKGSLKETEGTEPASAESVYWLNIKDGTMVKATSTWVKAPFPGAPMPIDAKVTLTREK